MKKLYVQEIIDYIEDHIEDEITVEQISSHIGYSKFYLNKLFSIFTGMSMIHYVRKRKLEYCLFDLNSDKSIIDIAFQYGFNSRRAFTRLFTNYYGDSPSNFRKNNMPLAPKINLNDIGGIKMLPYLSEPTVTTLNELYVLARRVVSKNPEDEVIGIQMEYKKKHNLETVREFGFDIPVSEVQQAQQLRGYEYWLCLDKDDYDNHTPEVSKKLIVPESKYFMLTISDPFKDPFERIPNGWKKLSSMMEGVHEFNPETISWGLEEVTETKGIQVMHIYIPIK